MKERSYIAIDLKSFYASVECVERGLDPLRTNLVVADETRTSKTICLAVTPSLKAQGVPGRPRLFEVEQKVAEINFYRRMAAPRQRFSGKSWDADALQQNPSLELDYIVAPPRMALYMAHSTRIYGIYLRHVAPEDIHVYSIDEVFIDATPYLKVRGQTPLEFARQIIGEVLRETGITATAGIGTNLYLCKVAMDIVAKHTQPDAFGARIAQLDEQSYRQLLWDHQPITDFWRVGRGYARKLEKVGIRTMGEIARCSLGRTGEFYNEDLLYRIFGVNAELLIDHAWGWESCTIGDIKAYRPETKSVGTGQVLCDPYPAEKGKLVAREMADMLVLDLVEKGLVTDKIVLTVGYDIENLKDPCRAYAGPVVTDPYGRKIPKHAHGTVNLHRKTASTALILDGVEKLYDRIVDPSLLVRRINLVAANVLTEAEAAREVPMEQLDLFSDFEKEQRERAREDAFLEREKRRQQALLHIRKKYGKNAIFKGMNLEEGATARNRNQQIGGHKA